MSTVSVTQTTDILIIGAGIVGLTLAYELQVRYPDLTITILEKEPLLAAHASGRNSGVLHAGLYYPPQTLKAKLCVEGARLMREYCETHHLPFAQAGKVILPTNASGLEAMETLITYAQANGVLVEKLDRQQLQNLEPDASSEIGQALFSPNTGSFDPKVIVNHLAQELQSMGVKILMSEQMEALSSEACWVQTQRRCLAYGHVFNTAGLHSDRLAHGFGIGQHYTMVPFKGLYYELSPQATVQIQHHLYPVPNLNIPFLGVHFTKALSGTVYVGPTAIPALSRENYGGFNDLAWSETPGILGSLAQLYIANQKQFRAYTHQEAMRFLKPAFLRAAQQLLPGLRSKDLLPSHKVGIRAQLMNKDTQSLVMDFCIERSPHATHILNAISPAFTSAFAFARFVIESYFDTPT